MLSNTEGLYNKYTVINNDTGETVEDCFILKPMEDKAAREALRCYAKATDNEVLSRDLNKWVDKIEVMSSE